MPGKKAKSPAKPVSKAVAPVAKGAPIKKGAAAAKASGPIGSLKKMLGIGGAAKPTNGKKAPVPAAKAGKAAAPALATKPVVAKPAAGKKVAAPAPVKGAAAKGAPVKGANGKGAPVTATVAKGAAAKGAAPAASPALTKPAKVAKPKKEPRQAHNGPGVCREVACELMATTHHYCRMHYIKNWKKIKRKEMILKERKLNHYIEELVSKYPDKYIEAIRQDLASEKDFSKVIADLEIDEGMDDFESGDTESAEGIIDNLKRDFEDEGDVF